MTPRFTVTSATKKRVIAEEEEEEEDDDGIGENVKDGSDSDSEVNPFDDEEFSEHCDEDNSEDDVKETLEFDEADNQNKRKFSEDNKNEFESKSKKKKTNQVSKKPPTADEMTRFRETQNLFHSNLFRMQIEEMLLEIKPKAKDGKVIRNWVEKFINVLSNIPEQSSEYSINDLSVLKEMSVKFPLPILPEDTKATFKFIKPSRIRYAGSFNSSFYVKTNFSLDITAVIPQEFFNKQDYLNCRYYRKRALYLCCIAEYLKSSLLLCQDKPIQFCVRSENALKPVLLLAPSAQWNSKVKVYLNVVPELDSFKLARFNPSIINIQQKWWSNSSTADNVLTSTPYYNASIGQDIVSEANESFCIEVLDKNPNLKDALLLLKVWFHQRELHEDSGGFNGFLLAMYLVFLYKNHKLNSFMSSYQILRNTWLHLCQTDWLTSGPSIARENSGPSLEEFHSNYKVVFVDVTGFVNLASNVTKLGYIRLKNESQLAMSYLDNVNLNSFQALFMKRMPFLYQFDHVIRINMKKAMQFRNKMKKYESEEIDKVIVGKHRLFVSVLKDLLERGLGNRASEIVVKDKPFISWSIDTRPHTDKVICKSILVGLKLNPQTALSVIEKGPEANLQEAAEFRKFWNSKSELRRFQDGTTCESLVWDTPDAPFFRRRLITQSIVEFLLTEKLMIPKTSYVYASDQLHSVLADKTLPPELGSIEELSLNVIKTFDSLVKQVKDLKNLPLPITSVLGSSSVLRFTDVFPPAILEGLSNCVDEHGHLLNDRVLKQPLVSTRSVEGVIQLGISKKWPENIEAIKRMRAAFVIVIAKELSKQCSLETKIFPDYLRVFKDGYFFNMRVVYPREIFLMRKITNSESLTAYRDTPESLKMEKNSVHLPKLTGALHGISQQYSGYGTCVCLTKRWFRSQMLDEELFPSIPIELIAASHFVSPEPFSVVLQPQIAFLRVLSTLANTNWCQEPVTVNFNGDLTSSDISDIEKSFRSGRENGSLPGLVIATPYDKTGIVWTRDAPSLPILYHTAKLAKESLSIMESNLLMADSSLILKTIFRPPLDFFDVLIHLLELKDPRRSQGIDWEEKKKKVKKNDNNQSNVSSVVDFNPVQKFLKELREGYSEFALFFHNTYGGNVIGVLFRPSNNEVQDFKVSHLSGRQPILERGETKLLFNREAIIEDFQHIGRNIVKSIVNQSSSNPL